MKTEYSHKAGIAAEGWDVLSLASEAEGSNGDGDDPQEFFEEGLKVANELWRMSARSKYAGKTLRVFQARRGNRGDVMFYFVALDEDELCERLRQPG